MARVTIDDPGRLCISTEIGPVEYTRESLLEVFETVMVRVKLAPVGSKLVVVEPPPVKDLN